MGYGFAESIRNMGGEVTLISGPVSIDPPSEISTIYIETTDDMYNEMFILGGYDPYNEKNISISPLFLQRDYNTQKAMLDFLSCSIS